MTKRLRTDSVIVPAKVKRPIDKQLIVVNQTATTSMTSTTLKTTTFPCTLTGLRWDFAANASAVAGTNLLHWAIVIVKDGYTANSFTTTDAADFYTPEQNVLTFGVLRGGDADAGLGETQFHWKGDTKTMRKLMTGDTVQFLSLSANTSGFSVDGIVQFFCKT